MQTLRALVIEDNLFISHRIRSMLIKAGFNDIEIETDLAGAMGRILIEHFGLIICAETVAETGNHGAVSNGLDYLSLINERGTRRIIVADTLRRQISGIRE